MSKLHTHAQLLNWTAHLMGKTWLADTNWCEFINTHSTQQPQDPEAD
ncbi:hypothetical protein OED52_13770 [Rhodococcus sp. Z13]|uniref:Uncharacterized protein n=1 Tax=Rhodococcus sacchari TaxID=2962047 RepID=A0ACD4DCQ1_9NOCA|nr:hypothetical protein [Rhodococcus sp. Z13]UYP17740.1 hypothetical protein OED52_13770 [Rhodococcus sp. Z13]